MKGPEIDVYKNVSDFSKMLGRDHLTSKSKM